MKTLKQIIPEIRKTLTHQIISLEPLKWKTQALQPGESINHISNAHYGSDNLILPSLPANVNIPKSIEGEMTYFAYDEKKGLAGTPKKPATKRPAFSEPKLKEFCSNENIYS